MASGVCFLDWDGLTVINSPAAWDKQLMKEYDKAETTSEKSGGNDGDNALKVKTQIALGVTVLHWKNSTEFELQVGKDVATQTRSRPNYKSSRAASGLLGGKALRLRSLIADDESSGSGADVASYA